MNCQVDIIVIGDSKAGHEAVKNIASVNPKIKMVFVSREFKSSTTHDYLNVEYIKEEVVFTDYKNRLFGCYLKNGDRIYGTHLIIASGLLYEPLVLNNKLVPCVYNNLDDIPKAAKSSPAIVLGHKNSDVKFALAVAKKHKHVYLCTKQFSLSDDVTPTNIKKLSEAKNIAILPNTTLLKVVTSDGILQAAELDNYSTVTCSAIYIKTDAVPEVNFVSDKLIKKTSTGQLDITDKAESTLVPKCYAIGNCAKKYTKRISQAMIESILNDF